MGKYLYIAEKPSVANEFAKALKDNFTKRDGYLESGNSVVTWCVGHLVTMSYPEVYDAAMKRWSLDTIPFLPREFRYEVIKDVSKQFNIVKGLLNRNDVERIYVCTDSGREGEYIYRLVDAMAGVPADKDKRRVWIDSQTEEEVLRGIREAKPLSEYDSLSDAAYLRAKEDYLMGINFSRVLTLKYGNAVRGFLGIEKGGAISVGRVMTCVLGMVVRREREIRAFTKTPFYRVLSGLQIGPAELPGEFRAVEGSKYYNTPYMYKENGFKERKTAEQMISEVSGRPGETLEYTPVYGKADERRQETDTQNDSNREPIGYKTICPDGLTGEIVSIEKKKEVKNPPLLFNLAELQNECSKLFKISPDETLNIVQELYEKKLVTYPRTDARVLSTAVAKEIDKNLRGLSQIGQFHDFAEAILASGTYKKIAATKYTNDKQITDHYAIIPTGQGFQNLSGLKPLAAKVYEVIGRRFLCIFLAPAIYRKIALTVQIGDEKFFSNFRTLAEEGWLKCAGAYRSKDKDSTSKGKNSKEKNASEADERDDSGNDDEEQEELGTDMLELLEGLKKGTKLPVNDFTVRMGETSAPKRYTSGSMILAMENAGQLIEDEELRAQIKGSGIGTSATRAEILKKLVKIQYLNLNGKTQVITPTLQGELVYEVVNASIRSLLNPELTASWEKGLTYVAEGQITGDEYMHKLEDFVAGKTNGVKGLNNSGLLRGNFTEAAKYYKQAK